MSNFVFVDPSIGQESDVRRAVRSHAMRDFRRRQRLQRTSQTKQDGFYNPRAVVQCRDESSSASATEDCWPVRCKC